MYAALTPPQRKNMSFMEHGARCSEDSLPHTPGPWERHPSVVFDAGTNHSTFCRQLARVSNQWASSLVASTDQGTRGHPIHPIGDAIFDSEGMN